MFISTVDTTMSSLYRGAKGGEIIGQYMLKISINGLEINLEFVMITFNHVFSVFNVCCGPRLILMTSDAKH